MTLSSVETDSPRAPAPRVAIRDVLCLSDLSTGSERALRQARELAERFDAELTIYHAVEKFDHPAYASFGQGDLLTREAERLARALLQRQVLEVRARCLVKVEVVESATAAVVEMVRGRRADITLMATHGRRGLSHLLLGSVAEKVVEHAHTPVLCLKEATPASYRRILVPTDLTLPSRIAFPMAAFFARAYEGEVTAVHVVPPPSVATLTGIPGPITPPPSDAEVWDFCRDDFRGIPLRAEVHTGTTWEAIVQTAEKTRADLIVMATRGHDSLSDRVAGSHTERVLRHAPCPVLVA
jgi:nucleotide-binding universal stress UspA family protein